MKKTYGLENDTNLKLVIGLSRAIKYLKSQESTLVTNMGLTMGQFGVLETLYHKGDLRICELIEKNLSSGGNMTVVINNLIKEGYVTKYRDPDDKRAFLVSLTETGYQTIHTLFPKHVDQLRDIMGHMDMDDKQALLALLKKFNGL